MKKFLCLTDADLPCALYCCESSHQAYELYLHYLSLFLDDLKSVYVYELVDEYHL